MSKGLIAFIIVALIGSAAIVVMPMVKSADKARKHSDEILKDFKTIDNSLQESNARLDSLKSQLADSLLKKYK